ncbi:MAG: GDP-mannose 4,6-dehydratase [Desulfobacterota bacterium]|nr:GDP-mannose 4,6-dehydratase [Thermodesulfobacteriota bacterium]
MRAVLVTGGAGFIGSHLCERLLRAGHGVICLDNFDPYYDPHLKLRNVEAIHKKFPDAFTLVTGDIRNRDHLVDLFKTYRPEAVFHLAAKAGVRPSIADPLLYEDVNVRGTLILLELCREFETPQFIFASSSSVYGENQKVPFSEDDPDLLPVSPYGITKRAGELFCFNYHSLFGMQIACLRIFTAYGPRQRPEMAIHKFTALIDRGEEVPVYGDGSSKRDYTYIDDLIDGMMAVLERHRGFEIYNLGESRTTSLIELIRLIEENLGKKAKILSLPFQPGDVSITYADITKARQKLGYRPKVPIEEGIKRFVGWYRGS